MIQYRLLNKEYLYNRYSLFQTAIINFYSNSKSYSEIYSQEDLNSLDKISDKKLLIYPTLESINNHWFFTFNLTQKHFSSSIQSLSIGFKNCYSIKEDRQIDFIYINCENAFGVSTVQQSSDIESARYRQQLLQYGQNTIVIDAKNFKCKVLDVINIRNDTDINMQEQLKQRYQYYNNL